MVLISDIADSIMSADSFLDAIIADYLNDNGVSGTVHEWRLNNYQQLRCWAYPSHTEYLDAVTKINSGDQVLVARGWVELDAYYQGCLAVKRRFPKPHEEGLGELPELLLRRVFVDAAQAHMDRVVGARRVFGEPDGRLALLSCCTYATSAHPLYGPDGRAAVQWRDAVWQRCEEISAAVEAGEMLVPTIDEFVAMLPPMVWPEVR